MYGQNRNDPLWESHDRSEEQQGGNRQYQEHKDDSDIGQFDPHKVNTVVTTALIAPIRAVLCCWEGRIVIVSTRRIAVAPKNAPSEGAFRNCASELRHSSRAEI